MRKDIVNIVNRLAEGEGLDFDLMKTYNFIFKYCKENSTRPSKNTYIINNGCLFINDHFITRVKPLPQVFADDQSLYYEGLILAITEAPF